MSMNFFNDVLAAIGKKLNYESISNLYGNSFAKNANKHIQAAYPLKHKDPKGTNGFAALINRTNIVKLPSGKQDKQKAVSELLGDSWEGDILA